MEHLVHTVCKKSMINVIKIVDFSDKPNVIGSDCSPSPKKFVANTERFELEEQKDERM